MSNTRHKGATGGDAAHEAHTAAAPAVEAGMSRDIINIPDNVILQGIKDYPQDDQDDIIRVFSWARQELRSRSRFCELLGVDWTTIVRVVQGKYPAGIDNFMRKVRDVNRRVREAGATGFVETLVTRKIFEALDYALAGDLDGGKIVLISGHTRRGKSYAAREWARRNNHGNSVYVDCPESGGLRALMYEIASHTGVNRSRNTADLRDRIIKSFHRRRILIFDEIARLLPCRWRQGAKELEFIRRIHDVRHCAVAFIATPVFQQEMQAGYLRDYLEQLLGRIAEPLYIPDKVYKSECRDIVSAFNPAPAKDLLALAHQIANQPGRLGVLYELLRQSHALARRKKERLQRKHLAAAYQRRQNRFSWPEED